MANVLIVYASISGNTEDIADLLRKEKWKFAAS